MTRAECVIPEIRAGGSVILNRQEWSWEEGVTTILGVNGAGETSLFRCLQGVSSPAAGVVVTTGEGERITSQDRPRFMAAVGFLPQDVPHLRTMTGAEFVTYAGWLKGRSLDAAAVARCLQQVNLAEAAHKRLTHLSGGMRRRVGIAAALAHDPLVLILDEPTAGLDPVERSRLHELIHQLDDDRVILISTHLLEDVTALQGTVDILANGTLSRVAQPVASMDAQALVALMEGAS